jgi:hypothetical protein
MVASSALGGEILSSLEVAPLDKVIKLLRVPNSAWAEKARDAERISETAEGSQTKSLLPPTLEQAQMPHQPLEVFACVFGFREMNQLAGS